MTTRLATMLLHWCWRIAAFATVAAAVVISVVRVLLPQIGDYQAEIEAWVSDYVAQPVVIERIAADWRGWTPEIELTNIELRDPTEARTLTRFEGARIAIDLWASLKMRRLVPGRLTVSGVKLSLLRSADGAIRMEGVEPQRTDIPGVRQNALADWLQRQRNLTIESANITWHDERALFAPVVLSDVWLHIRSYGDRRQLAGSARLPADVGRAFHFLLDARGDLLTTTWSGELFIEGQGINPAVVLNYRRWLGLGLGDGEIGFRLWSRWRDARLSSVDGQIEAEHIALGVHDRTPPEARFAVDHAASNLRVRRTGDGRWTIALEKLELSTAHGAWPQSALTLTLAPAGGGDFPTLVAQAGFLRLEDVAPLVLQIGAVPEAICSPLRQFAPRGDLRDVRFGYFPDRAPDARFYVQTRFSGIDTQPTGDVPGIAGLAGEVKADASGGRLHLERVPLTVAFGERTATPTRLSHLAGDVRWARTADGWRLSTDRVDLAHPALSVGIFGDMQWQPGSAPTANLLADVGGGDFEQLAALLPPGVVNEKAYAWIKKAVHAGTITTGAAVLRGPLDRFPFDHKEGVFKLLVTVTDGQLEFHPAWPRLEDIDADIRFEGRTLTVSAPAAAMLGAELRDVTASIADLSAGRKSVVATGKVHATAATALRFVAGTPLRERLGPQLAGLEVSGDLDLDLALDIPLRPGERPASRGTLHLRGERVVARDFQLELEDVSGPLDFDNGAWSAPGLTASFRGRPVQLALTGGSPEAGGNRYVMRGQADRAVVEQEIDRISPTLAEWSRTHGVFTAIDGVTPWEARLAITRARDTGRPTGNLRIRSALEGLALDLPAPAGKTAAETVALSLTTRLGGDGPRVLAIQYGDRVRTRLSLGRTADGKTSLTGASVAFGGSEPRRDPPAAVWLEGRLAELAPTQWYDLFARAPRRTPPPAVAYDLQIDELLAFGQRFAAVHASGRGDSGGWQVDLDADSVAGHIELPAPGQGEPVRAQLHRLRLARAKNGPESPGVNPAHLPAIEGYSDQFVYGDMDLGRAEIATRPRDAGLELARLAFTSPGFLIEASGDWRREDAGDQCHFLVTVKGADIGKLLGRFGYDVTPIQSSSTSMRIDALWRGTPADFALATLQGELHLAIGNGRLLDIDPHAGRLFGLLSIQTLPRRLALDFDDLFRKGFSFDSIEGSFVLEQGNAYTNNLIMDGPAARIEITGRTGLAEQDYDQLVTVRPQVSSTLPLASAVFGPVGAGVGAVLFLGQKMFKALPQLDNMISRQYSVTGHWHEPVIEQVKGLDLSFGG
ncbi:MAG: TIGR02099 family protein [Gammaproteobacteria bacterium]|nr:TIGR02099 family protein [Gammaproteobacteria bacterium]